MSEGLMCLKCHKYIGESPECCQHVTPTPSFDGVNRARITPPIAALLVSCGYVTMPLPEPYGPGHP